MKRLAPVLLGLSLFCAPVAAQADDRLAEQGLWGAAEVSRRVVDVAMEFIGVRYRFGGNHAESGVDCSGLVRLIWSKLGLAMQPRTAREMAQLGTAIDTVSLRAGDLVFFNTLGRAFSHVGVYIGDGKFVHASSGRGRVMVSSLSERYFVERFQGARRVVEE